ncbi:MAG: stage III sporulation protein AE, partial [Lachnospiraceae bacterium]|nr:stage III sporulation protein AE [Lachnospiraceae bacterium]
MLTKLVATALQAGVINDSMWQEYGLEKLENGISELFPRIEFSLGDLLAKVAQGEILSALGDLFQGIFSDVTTQMLGLRNVMVWLIVLGIVSALLSQFSDIFNHNQISDISFYFIYLLVVAVLLTCFWEVASVAMNMVENLILCIKLLVPTYVIAVGVSSGTTTVMAYYQLLLLLIYGVQSLLVGVLVPFIYSYIMLSVVNGVWIEEKLSLLLDLIEKGIKGALKAAIWLVTGISVFQSL